MAPVILSGSARFNEAQDSVDAKGTMRVSEFEYQDSKYPQYLPTWDRNEHYPPYEEHSVNDKGLLADPNFKDLLSFVNVNEKLKLNDLSPKLGTEVHGIQLSKLSDSAKNDLALFVAQRGLAVFRNQDFKDLSVDKLKEYVSYYGNLHIHPSSGQLRGHPEFHVIYRRKNDNQMAKYFSKRTTSVAWHSDVTYEKQPLGLTFLVMVESPSTGGDTAFADTVEAYERLSPQFKKILEPLYAVHSAHEQAADSLANGGVVRRDPITTVHPVVRTHPVTGKKSLFVNPQFTRSIVGLKEEESNYLLDFLYDHLSKGHDFQVRARWDSETVVVFDNRVLIHSALYDLSEHNERRLAFRLGAQGERPFNSSIDN